MPKAIAKAGSSRRFKIRGAEDGGATYTRARVAPIAGSQIAGVETQAITTNGGSKAGSNVKTRSDHRCSKETARVTVYPEHGGSMSIIPEIKQAANFRAVDPPKNCDLCEHFNGSQQECWRLDAYQFSIGNADPERRVCDYFKVR